MKNKKTTASDEAFLASLREQGAGLALDHMKGFQPYLTPKETDPFTAHFDSDENSILIAYRKLLELGREVLERLKEIFHLAIKVVPNSPTNPRCGIELMLIPVFV